MVRTSRNPYVRAGRRPTLRKSVVAFIDILGYTDMVRSLRRLRERQKLLSRLHGALKGARKLIDPDEDGLGAKLGEKDGSALRAFTDNIVIGYPMDDGASAESKLFQIFSDVSYFQMTMTLAGFFIRGGVAIGDLYMDDITVFGAGLMEAYEAEVKLARDPRIVLAHSAREAVNEHLEHYGRGPHAPQNRDLLKDTDGQYFVHYLETIVPEDGYFYEKELRTHGRIVEERLRQHRDRPPIWSKYMWTATYHNYYCDHCDEADDSMKVKIEEFALKPTRIIERV